MDERAHAELLKAALERSGVDWLARRREALLQGNDDEDVHIVPLLGWRLRAVGLTHTYRPGRRGELGAPSALTLGDRYVARALECRARDPSRAAHLLGRTSHLLVDTAVPARARGVWHLLGDPFEQEVERRAGEIPALGCAPIPRVASLGELFESLATLAAGHVADTTRNPWSALRLWLGGGGTRVSSELAFEQARVLVPAAVAHVAALFQQFESWPRLS